MMLEYLGWRDAAERLREGLIRTIAQKTVTYDLARQMEGATEVKCSQFAKATIKNM
jgi:isocitrate dehydrogenase